MNFDYPINAKFSDDNAYYRLLSNHMVTSDIFGYFCEAERFMKWREQELKKEAHKISTILKLNGINNHFIFDINTLIRIYNLFSDLSDFKSVDEIYTIKTGFGTAGRLYFCYKNEKFYLFPYVDKSNIDNGTWKHCSKDFVISNFVTKIQYQLILFLERHSWNYK